MVYIRGVMLHPPMARLATVAELMQYSAEVVHPKAKSAGAVQWAHSSLSRIASESLVGQAGWDAFFVVVRAFAVSRHIESRVAG